MKLKKSLLLIPALLFSVSANADAASVAGSDFWSYMDEKDYLTKEKPFAFFGGVKYELSKFSAPENYPKKYHENKHYATGYVGFSWLFTKNWTLNGYFGGERKWKRNHDTENKGIASGYIEGKIGSVMLRAGAVPAFDLLYLTNGGLVNGTHVVGGQVRVPVGNWKILLTGGSVDDEDYDYTRIAGIKKDSTYVSLTAWGDIGKNISAGVGVHNMENSKDNGIFENGTKKNNTVAEVGIDYKFAKHWTFGGAYAGGNAEIAKGARYSDDEKKSYSIQLTYGSPESDEVHNTSAWVAYRHLGRTGSYTPAFKGAGVGERGFEIGARHILMKNLSLETAYFNGKKISELSFGADRPKVHNWYMGLEYSF